MVFLHIQHSEERIGVTLVPVDLYGGAEQRLRQDQVRECGDVKEGVVGVEELAQQRLEPVEVVRGLRVEHLEVDIDNVEGLGVRVRVGHGGVFGDWLEIFSFWHCGRWWWWE